MTLDRAANVRYVSAYLRWKVARGLCRDCKRPRGRGVRCKDCAKAHSVKQARRNKRRKVSLSPGVRDGGGNGS